MMEQNHSPLTIEEKRLLLLRRRRGAAPDGGVGAAGIPALDHDGPVPASFAQRRLWFLDRLAPGNPFYTVSLVVDLDGRAEPEALTQALAEISRRHSALRTTFAERDGQPMQIVHPDPMFPLDCIDLALYPRAEAERRLEALIAAETRRHFDLERGPLAVARLVRLAPDRHRLLLTLHHIVCDGWSLRILGRELTAIYGAFVAGRPHDLPAPAIQYRDFSAWQHDMLSGGALERHLDFWRRTLAEAPELAIPTDFLRPAVPSYGGAFVPLTIAPDCAQQIRNLCATEGTTPFMVLLSAWMVLLSRHAEMEDILVAVPSAGRARRETEPLIGFFVNTLVLRGDLSGDPAFRTLLRRIRDTCLAAFEHEDLPFDRLIEALAPERRGDRNPLAQVIFQLFSAPDRAVGGTTPAERQRGTAKFDLRLDLWDTAQGYAGELEYSTDLFAPATAALMAEQFLVLVQGLVAQPDRPIAEAGMMSRREYDWLTRNCNHTDRPWPAQDSIVSRFAGIVRAHGGSTAIAFGDRVLSYARLDDCANAAAAELAAAGVGPGDRVVTLLPRGATMVVAWLAILKLGAAYVPLDADTPPARLHQLCATSGARLAVTAPTLAGALAGAGPAPLTADLDRWLGMRAPAPGHDPAPDDVANVMFTSGSTGRPKGVLVPHRGVLRLVVGTDYIDLRPDDGIAQASNVAFDAATFEVWAALLNGCRLVGIGRDCLLSPPLLAARLAQGDIQHLFVTTALFKRLAEDDPAMFNGLRTVITGGERADAESFRRVLAQGGPGRLCNAYGPTEATTFATLCHVTAVAPCCASVPIGQPIANTTAYVVDRLGRPVPRGVPGELLIGGPGVALGYLDEPEMTARRFGPSPFREGERLYATGDRVRRLADGEIEFLGRIDDQVKIRGFRVEPAEIAALLRTHPGISDAEVIVTPPTDTTDARILAFHVPAEAAPEGDAAGADRASIAYWRKVYDEVIYEDIGSTGSDAEFETAGWADSATGALLPAGEMAEQVQAICARVGALGGDRLLEFGCGTGLLLFPLARRFSHVVGIDISSRALAHVRATADRAGLSNIDLRPGSMEALADLPAGGFDTILLNSTAQYFPSAAYFEALIGALIRVSAPGASLFLGDIRHLGLLECFLCDMESRRMEAGATAADIRRDIRRKLEEEQELVLDPGWFTGLPGRFPRIGTVEIQLKRGAAGNELVRFRYDVTLRLDEPAPLRPARTAIWGQDVHDLDGIVARYRSGQDLLVRAIPNARVAGACTTLRRLEAADDHQPFAAIAAASRDAEAGALDPETVWTRIDALGAEAVIGWGAEAGCFDLLIRPRGQRGGLAAPEAPGDRAALATDPQRGRRLRQLDADLAAWLDDRLPDYMRPHDYVRMAAIPLTANGKVDRRALLAQAPRPQRRAVRRQPETATEHAVADIFAAVLQLPAIDVDDDFFALGGHSLKATQVISRIRAGLGVTLPLRAIFEHGSIAGLARMVEAARAGGGAADAGGPAASDAGARDVDAMDDAELARALAALEVGEAQQETGKTGEA